MDKNIIKGGVGLWKDLKETGLEYERRLRKRWLKRRVKWVLTSLKTGTFIYKLKLICINYGKYI